MQDWKTQNSVESIFITAVSSRFSQYHGITVTFVPDTVSTAVKLHSIDDDSLLNRALVTDGDGPV